MLQPDRSMLRDGVSAVLLYLLLAEWLKPLLEMSQWSGIYRISPFMLAFGLFVAVDWLRPPAWLGWLLKAVVMVGIVGFLFDPGGFPHPSWFVGHFGLTMKDALALADGDFVSFSPENRTLLFLLGWAMLIAVIYASVVERQQALWFVAATLLYLLGLQLWPGVNTAGAIIRTVWFGFLLMGLSQLSRLENRYALSSRSAAWPFGWLVAVPLLLSAALAAGLWLPPKMSTGVMKPVDADALAARFASWNGGSGPPRLDSGAEAAVAGGLTARTGYREDDSNLGGPVSPDDSVAFLARTERPTYWRGEAKTRYTGKGWEDGESSAEPDGRPASTDTITQEVMVGDEELAGRLFAGGPVEKIESLVTRSGRPMQPDESVVAVAGAYLIAARDAKDPLYFYRMRVSVPREEAGFGLPNRADAETAGASAEELRPPDPSAFQAELQLPAGLPDRVEALADALTAGIRGDAERAHAIEAYLKTNYTYRMDVPDVPKEAADFADYFLFEAKTGYCDYFSTAMTVLLRSAGIPARWVKGFAPGEVTEDNRSASGEAGGMIHVTVRNRDAHSWVEAYIAGKGWTTFDPTPALPGSAAAEAASAAVQAAVADPAGSPESAAPSSTSEAAKPDAEPKAGVLAGAARLLAAARADGAWLSRLAPYKLELTAALLLLPLAALLPRLLRGRAFRTPSGSEVRYSDRYDLGGRAPRYRLLDKLWRRLFGRLGPKRPVQTVREYVDSLPVSKLGQRDALLEFVRLYEDVRYGGHPLPRAAKLRVKDAWRRIKESGRKGAER